MQNFRSKLSLAFIAILASLPSHPALAAPAIPVAITVDDLPVHGSTLPSETRVKIADRFLAALKKHRIVEAYGFLNAKKVKDDPATLPVLERWKAAGYPLGNHAYSHMRLNTATAEDFIADIKANESLLATLESPSTYRWFRYPFLNEGDTREKRTAVRAALRDLQYKIAQVTVDFGDFAWNDAYVRCVRVNNQTAIRWLEKSFLEHALVRLQHAQASAQVLFGRPIPHILLLHIGIFNSLMLDRLLTEYKKAGADFVRLKEAASDPIYLTDPGLTPTAGKTFLDQMAASKGIRLPPIAKIPYRTLRQVCNKGT